MTNETDRDLLELAALAAGYDAMEGYGIMGPPFLVVDGKYWDPLADDGDALRLAVRLNLSFQANFTDDDHFACAGIDNPDYCAYEPGSSDIRWIGEGSDPDPFVAARRAITLAAAEIGKKLKEKNHA